MKKQDILKEINRVIDSEIESIVQSRDLINDDFADAVIKISEANKVIVSGVGKSGIIGKKISATLSSIGISSVFVHPVEALHGDLGMIQREDVAILLSKSGSTEELVKFIPYLKMREASIISITGNVNSFLSKNSNITINASVEREACMLNLAPTSSTTLALVLGDALAMAAMKYRNVTREDFAKLHPLGQLGRNITLRVKDCMHKNDSLPIVAENTLFKDSLIEMTKKELGCVCIVNDDNILKGIITDGDVRRFLQFNDNFKGLKVDEIMTKEPIYIDENYFLGEALALMEKRDSQISILPVLKDKKLVGVIRIHDIIGSGI
jgi:arabinose-5-phosphate isomerase